MAQSNLVVKRECKKGSDETCELVHVRSACVCINYCTVVFVTVPSILKRNNFPSAFPLFRGQWGVSKISVHSYFIFREVLRLRLKEVAERETSTVRCRMYVVYGNNCTRSVQVLQYVIVVSVLPPNSEHQNSNPIVQQVTV